MSAVFERLVLFEMEKNSHSRSNAVSFAVTVLKFLSGLTGSELCLFKNRSQSVVGTNLQFRDFLFLLLDYRRSLLSVFVGCYCTYGKSVTR